MTTLKQQANAVTNGMNEAVAGAIITLYDNNLLKKPFNKDTRRDDIESILVNDLNWRKELAEYWIAAIIGL